jgi:hypothetical protein
MRGVEKLAKDGESALIALAHEATRMSTLEAAVEAGVGTSRGRAMGAVAAEAAAAAAAVWAALVASGARPAGAAAFQSFFIPPALESSSLSSPAASAAWPTRVFAQRALAALIAPGSPLAVAVSRYQGYPFVADGDLTPSLTLWALSAASDVATGGVGPLAAALFAHPALPALNEGAAAGPAAAAVTRLQVAATAATAAAAAGATGGIGTGVEAAGEGMFAGAAAGFVAAVPAAAALRGLSPGADGAGGGDPAVAAAPGEVLSRAEVGAMSRLSLH